MAEKEFFPYGCQKLFQEIQDKAEKVVCCEYYSVPVPARVFRHVYFIVSSMGMMIHIRIVVVFGIVCTQA